MNLTENGFVAARIITEDFVGLEIYGLCTAGYAECAQFSYAFALDNKF
jgi:hypothetical protein